jgi:capsular polysaccharide biosynthesis protein
MDRPHSTPDPFGQFEPDDVPATAGFAAFRRAALDPDALDCRFNHTPDRLVDVVPHGLVTGVSVFGPGQPAIASLRDDPVHRLARVSSFMLNDAVLAPGGMAVLDANDRMFGPSVDNLAAWGHRLPAVDPAFIDVAGGWRLQDPASNFTDGSVIALPVGGVGSHNYGHFLYDGLAAALHHRLLLGRRAVLVGRPLLGWQADILEMLGLLDGYVALNRPTRFRKLVTSTMVSQTVSYPNRFVRAVFDRMRSCNRDESARERRLFLTRHEPGNRRIMANRRDVEAIAADFGFEVIAPATMTVAAQVRCFAGADCVIGESGAGLANLGFCDPGTRVLELQPDCFSDGWTRAACHLLGLKWHVFFAQCRQPTSLPAEPAFEFDVDPTQFRSALHTVFGTP